MHNEPEATDEEHELGLRRRAEEDAMRGAEHDDPESVGKDDGEDDDEDEPG